VPCEHLFSASKQTADDQRVSLGAEQFEELQMMKFAWWRDIFDVASWNSREIEEVDLDEYREILSADAWAEEFEKEDDEFVLEDSIWA